MKDHAQIEMCFHSPDIRGQSNLIEPPALGCSRVDQYETIPAPRSSGDAESSVLATTSPLPPPETLAEMLSRLEASGQRRRRDCEMKSALRRMGDALRKPLYQIPTDPQILRGLMSQVTPSAVEMTAARWSRVRSLTLACMRDMGCDTQPGRDPAGHSPAWKALAARLPTKAQKFAMSRFMSFCTRGSIEPHNVTAETFGEYQSALARRSLKSNPDRIYRGTVKSWNAARMEHPDWPQVEILLQRHPHFYSYPWSDFPTSLVEEVEKFLLNEGDQNEFSDDYMRAMRPATIALHRRQLRQLSSQLVLSGLPIDSIKDLAVLTRFENVKAALSYQQKRNDGKIGKSLGQIAFLASNIARRWVRDVKTADRLAAMANRIGGGKQKGMTARNKDRLRQFDHRENVDVLMLLPGKIYRQIAGSKTITFDSARRAMSALAVEILTVAPMRVSNLVKLELEKHLLVTGRGKGQTRRIYIPGEETKTGEPFEVILSDSTAAMIDRFLRHYRPHLLSGASPFLFPSQTDRPRSVIAFSRLVSEFIKRETGLIMHVHLFRQLSGRLYLDANPTDFETVRKFLGHKNITTTLSYYVEHKTAHAFARYDATVAGLRAKAQDRAGKRRDD